jgi:hypothetical protein
VYGINPLMSFSRADEGRWIAAGTNWYSYWLVLGVPLLAVSSRTCLLCGRAVMQGWWI